jgi:hypothetical protein
MKLAVGAYEWKKKASVVADTLTEEGILTSFRASHQKHRFTVHLKPQSGMPKTFFNKNHQ